MSVQTKSWSRVSGQDRSNRGVRGPVEVAVVDVDGIEVGVDRDNFGDIECESKGVFREQVSEVADDVSCDRVPTFQEDCVVESQASVRPGIQRTCENRERGHISKNAIHQVIGANRVDAVRVHVEIARIRTDAQREDDRIHLDALLRLIPEYNRSEVDVGFPCVHRKRNPRRPCSREADSKSRLFGGIGAGIGWDSTGVDRGGWLLLRLVAVAVHHVDVDVILIDIRLTSSKEEEEGEHERD